jgi:N-acylneuraminate cytidylyltransferase
LIAWSIEAAKGSELVGTFCVSTDDPEIAAVATEFEAEVLPRPVEFAGDRTPMIDVVRHALQTYEERLGVSFDYFLLLQPTAPARTAQDIDLALKTLVESEADSVISVYQVEDAHPARMYLIQDGRLQPFYQEPPGSLRQDLPKVYHRNGAIYATTCRLIKEEGRLWGGRIVPYLMPKERSINIDDMQDLAIANFLLNTDPQGSNA